MSWTEEDQARATTSQQLIVQDVHQRWRRFQADAQRDQRLQARECPTCWYLASRIAGQAFTEYHCRRCEQPAQHPNTRIPRLCRSCAEAINACQHCGGDLNSPTPGASPPRPSGR